MAQISLVQKSQLEGAMRLDAEYYRPEYLQAYSLVKSYRPLREYQKRILHPKEIKRVYAEDDSGIVFLLAQNIKRGYLDFSTEAFVTSETAAEIWQNKLEFEDVVLTRTGANYGDTACYLGIPSPVYASAHCLVIRPKEISGPFLSVYLNTQIGRTLVKRGVYGSSQPEIAPDYLKTIPIPRLGSEQELRVEELVRSSMNLDQKSGSLSLQAEQILLDELGFKDLDLSHQLYYTTPYKKAKEANRLDAEHFQPKYERIEEFIKKREHVTLGSLGKVLRGRNPGDYTEEGIPVIRAIDLRNILDTSTFLRCHPEKRLFYLSYGDILISSIGWGSIGKVATFTHQEQMVTVSEVSVIRQTKMQPIALQILLQSPLGQLQLECRITGSTGQLHLYPKDIETVIIPCLAPSLQQRITDLVTQSWEARQKAKQLLEEAKHKVENIIEKGVG